MSNIPFLPASRWFDGEGVYARPWRLNTIGDPLMLGGPSGTVHRVMNSAVQSPDYLDASVVAKEAMQFAVKEPTDANFSIAINAVLLLANQSSIGSQSARAALPALFRQQEVESFLRAFKLIRSPSRIEKDMLWHLVGTSRNTSLQLLIDNLRSPYSLDDLAVIADRIKATRGANAVLSIIEEKLRGARGRTKRGLERMRKEYGG